MNPSDLLLASLGKFYDDDSDSFEHVRRVLCNETISLRILDWFVTNYAKKHNVSFQTDDGRFFNVFLEYKAQLKSFSKRFFDPFCRGERLEFRGLHTTVGQLNFFRWSIKHGVVAHCIRHAADIEADMMDSMKTRKMSDPGEKRKELSKAAIKRCISTSARVRIRFE
jgi:hypothetical protein